MIKIYHLRDPNTTEIRYVGKTSESLSRRLSTHVTHSKYHNHHTACWVRSLLTKGLRPKIELIEEVDVTCWREREQYWIATYRNHGLNLTNLTDGGDGMVGYQMSDAQRAEISGRVRRFRHSQATKQYLSETWWDHHTPRRGFQQSEVHKARIGNANRGERNGQARLTAAIAQQIKVLATQHLLTHQEIADIYGISRRTVGFIKAGKRWAHLPGLPSEVKYYD